MFSKLSFPSQVSQVKPTFWNDCSTFLPVLFHPQTWSWPPRWLHLLCQTLPSERPAPSCLTPSLPHSQRSILERDQLRTAKKVKTVNNNTEPAPLLWELIVKAVELNLLFGVCRCCTCSLLMASESWSAFTLQATSSWAVEDDTCLAEEMSFSSLAWPCTEALAASHRLLVAAATIRAWKREAEKENVVGKILPQIVILCKKKWPFTPHLQQRWAPGTTVRRPQRWQGWGPLFPEPPALSGRPRPIWPKRWWLQRWTWLPPGSAPRSSASRPPAEGQETN